LKASEISAPGESLGKRRNLHRSHLNGDVAQPIGPGRLSCRPVKTVPGCQSDGVQFDCASIQRRQSRTASVVWLSNQNDGARTARVKYMTQETIIEMVVAIRNERKNERCG